MNYDVVTLGETMLRLTPPGMLRFEQTQALEIHIGGSESNTAVGLARLGARVAWLSRLTNNPFGRLIAQQLEAQGVDVSHVVWTNDDRVGTYFLERGKLPRGSQVIYDRKLSAASRFQPHELPGELFQTGCATWLHTTGISIGISPTSAQTVMRAIEMAKEVNWPLSFDLNFRAKLWSPAEARTGCEPAMRQADLIFLPRRDAQAVFAIADLDPRNIVEELSKLFPQATVVLTLGAQGAVAIDSNGQVFEQAAFPAEEVERLGGGDAFSAGFLFKFIATRDLPLSLKWGAATAAMKYSIPGELPLVHRGEVETLVSALHQSSVSR